MVTAGGVLEMEGFLIIDPGGRDAVLERTSTPAFRFGFPRSFVEAEASPAVLEHVDAETDMIRTGNRAVWIAAQLAIVWGSLGALASSVDARTLVARIDTTLYYEPDGRFNGAWQVGLPLEPGIAGDWSARGWPDLVFDGVLRVRSMNQPFAVTGGFAEAEVGSGEIGKHGGFGFVGKVGRPATYSFSSDVPLGEHGKGGDEHSDFHSINSFFFIIWQPHHTWQGPEQFAMDPDYYPISLSIEIWIPIDWDPPVETAVTEAVQSRQPQAFTLEQNFPNPFNSSTVFRYALSSGQRVELSLYSLTGQKVVSLADGYRPAGVHAVRWDGRDDGGERVASGAYLYRLQVGDQAAARRLLLLR